MKLEKKHQSKKSTKVKKKKIKNELGLDLTRKKLKDDEIIKKINLKIISS
jgi:hypothetical protein